MNKVSAYYKDDWRVDIIKPDILKVFRNDPNVRLQLWKYCSKTAKDQHYRDIRADGLCAIRSVFAASQRCKDLEALFKTVSDDLLLKWNNGEWDETMEDLLSNNLAQLNSYKDDCFRTKRVSYAVTELKRCELLVHNSLELYQEMSVHDSPLNMCVRVEVNTYFPNISEVLQQYINNKGDKILDKINITPKHGVPFNVFADYSLLTLLFQAYPEAKGLVFRYAEGTERACLIAAVTKQPFDSFESMMWDTHSFETLKQNMLRTAGTAIMFANDHFFPFLLGTPNEEFELLDESINDLAEKFATYLCENRDVVAL
jgi:hypothetical protein